MRKRTKRKIWNRIDPVAHAIAGAAKIDEASLNIMRINELAAIDAMAHGQGTLTDYRLLADMLNVSERMAENNIGPEALDACRPFNDELAAMAQRYERTGKFGFAGGGLALAQDVYQYHDLQRQSITRAQYENMIKKTADYLRSNGHLVVNVE
jgi:hypothetical protein